MSTGNGQITEDYLIDLKASAYKQAYLNWKKSCHEAWMAKWIN